MDKGCCGGCSGCAGCAGCPGCPRMADLDNFIMEPAQPPLIGDPAPEFVTETTNGEINFPADYKGKWVILFSHPSDFTPVCTTEFMTFATMQQEFEELNTELIGLSIDSLHSHIAWIQSIKKIEFKGMKNVEINFPIIDDLSMNVASLYGMIQPNQSETSAVRAVFVIDPEGIIRTILYYPQSTGRNFDEIKRIVQALQKTDAEGVATPADWRPGDDAIIPPVSTTKAAREVMKKGSDSDREVKDWFMVFKKSSK